MPRLKAANNAITTLTAAIDAVQTSFTVADASLFPNAPFRVTIDAEIMEVGAINRTTNTFSSVTRAVEQTVAAPHAAGASVENRFTAGTFAELADKAQDVDTHVNATAVHGAVSTATANRIIVRDANARAQVADGVASADICTKGQLDTHAALTSAHSATDAATPSRIILRDTAGRAKVADGVAASDICTKGQLDAAIANVAARIVYVQDDTEVSVTGTTETTRKSFKLVKHSTHGINVKNIWFAAELRVSAGTGTIRLYQGTTLLLSAQTTSTSYVLVVAGPFDASGWANGIYEFTVRLLNSGSNTTHNRFFELYVS